MLFNDVEIFAPLFDNSVDALVPEHWANESLMILEENMVAANLVHRDFEPIIAKYGDVVNTRKPSALAFKRKAVSDNVTVQDAILTNVPVPLDQLAHVSILIRDGEESKSFKNLAEEFIRPAMSGMAGGIDRVVLGQYPQFIRNVAGSLGQISSTNVKGYMLDTRKVMNINKATDGDRNLIWTPNAETEALKLDLFTQANTVGDDGTALRKALLGNKLNFYNYMAQNMGSVATGNTEVHTYLINNASGYAKGTTTFAVDTGAVALGNNSFCVVDGDYTPLRIVSTVGGSTVTSITVAAPGLNKAVVNNAVVTVYTPGAVNLSGGYAAGYAKEIIYDTFTVDPQVGQMVSFGTSASNALYTIIAVDTSGKTILLDRPLAAAISNDDAINLGPPGEYNLAFEKNAIALVVRPLSAPLAGTGARSAVVNYNGLSMRVVITYDGNKQGHLITFDVLFGVAVLDYLRGAILLG